MKSKNNILIAIVIAQLCGCAGTQVKPSQVEPDATIQPMAKVEKSNDAAVTGNGSQATAEEVIVCKQRRPTGSRIPKRECMSKESWNRVEQASQDAREKLNKPAYNRVNED